MLEFHPDVFLALLRQAQEPLPLYEEPAHSDYLQTEVFNRLSEGETIDLSRLDLDAFELRHVTPDWYERHFDYSVNAWQRGLNKAFKLAPPAAKDKRAFF